jgi:multiple sugar transport system permease protein
MPQTPLVGQRVRRAAWHAVLYVVLLALSALFVLPLAWLVSTSLKSDVQMGAWPPIWIPRPLVWQNFSRALSAGYFWRYLQNTTLIAVLGTLGQVLTASMAAFGFARLRFPGRDFLFSIMLATMMLPGVVTLIPTFILFRRAGWIDTYLPLIVPAYLGGGAFSIFLLRQFFRTIPQELFDQAKIDGASDYRMYFQIMLPLCRPALATVAIFGFMFRWNDLMGPLMYINSGEKLTLTLGLQRFMSDTEVRYQEMMGMSLLMTLPLLVAFLLFQREFVQGVVMSGLKG